MSKSTLFAIIFLSIVVSGCELTGQEPNDMPCGPKTCTAEFASIGVKFVDKTGNAVVVKDFTSINKRTGLNVKYAGSNSVYVAGNYGVATDSDLKDFSETGDDVLVSGTHPSTGQIKTATFKVSGGCACHIRKISGPTEIVFD